MAEIKGQSNMIQVALAGNPNCGKTTIFNNLTGAKQHVGNYAGVTVEKKVGYTQHNGKDIEIVDLPGTYSLTARSIDELVARDVIINTEPDLIMNVVDASNLERNLYLTAQLIELNRPTLLVLNMVDVAKTMGLKINKEKLAELTGTTVVEAVGRTNIGTPDILQGIVDVKAKDTAPNLKVNYGEEIEPFIDELTAVIDTYKVGNYPSRWVAVKLLEHDEDVLNKVKELLGDQANIVLGKVVDLRSKVASKVDIETVFQERRHRFAVDVFHAILEDDSAMVTETVSDKIDKVLTNRVLGLPIFALIMWTLFNLVFTLGAYPQGWIEDGMTALGEWVGPMISSDLLRSMVVDGAIGGVGAVLSFVPLIVILFVGISFLEDSGYMARAAFVMDRIMRACGLHGKSFIPLLLGFGCNVPAIMGARILDNPKDRMVTILVSPFMSCSARLPVYTLLIGAFFPTESAGTMLFAIYALGILVAVTAAFVLRKTSFSGEAEPFVMEMPPYHMPTFKSVIMHMWERTVLYLKKAGTFILLASIAVWILVSFPQDVTYSKDYDAAKEQVTATYDGFKDQALATFNITDDAKKEEIDGIVEEMKAAEEAQAGAEPGEEEQSADAGDATDAKGEEAKEEASNDSDEIKAPELEPVDQAPVYFADIKEKNAELFPAAWAAYQIETAKDDATKELDIAQNAEKIEQSYAATLGKAIEPIMEPIGFKWKVNVAIVAAVAAKEVMVSTLGTIYAVEASDDDTEGLTALLQNDPDFSPAIGLGLIVFSLLYLPCLATMAVIKRETGSWKWFFIVFAYTNILAWGGAYITVHVARAFGIA